MATVPGFQTGTPTAGNIDINAANAMTQGRIINNDYLMQQGQANSQWINQTAPELNAGIAAAGEWYSGARKVAQGNAIRHFKDASADLVSTANNALSQLYTNQGQAAVGAVSV